MYSLLPIDCGFCPRRAGLVILLPADATRVRYRWRRADRVAAGPDAAAVAGQLRGAGYRVRVVERGPLTFERP